LGAASAVPADLPVTPAPSDETLKLMRTTVAPMLAEVYPQFAKNVFGAVIPGRPEGPSPESITTA
jgi:hypothetical protein